MKIIFFGSSEFAVESLEKLANSQNEIVCVVTQPDRKKGRNLLFSSTAVKSTAVKFNLRLLQPEETDSNFIKTLKKFEAELFVVISYGIILPKELLVIPKKMAINVHASLLPKYRGAAPINWAIIRGEKQTGITIIKMNELMDQGKIIYQKEMAIEDIDTSDTLNRKLSILAAECLIKTIKDIENDKINFIEQDVKKATYAPKLTKSHGAIDWSKSAKEIHNQIRGTIPWPGSYTHWQGKLLKIWESNVLASENRAFRPGEIIAVSKDGILVKTGQNSLIIETLQLEAAKKLNAEQFICGHKIKQGDILS
jgi:methionyl-tRNA formyltransferase